MQINLHFKDVSLLIYVTKYQIYENFLVIYTLYIQENIRYTRY